MVIQGDGQHSQHDLGCLFREAALDAALPHPLADDVGQDGFQFGDDDAGELLVYEGAFLLFVEGVYFLPASQFHGGVQAGVVYDFQFFKGIQVGGRGQLPAFVQDAGVVSLNHCVYDIVLGGKIVIDTSFPDTGFLGNITDGNGLDIGRTHKFLHGIQYHVLFIMVLHEKSSVFSLEYIQV